MTQHDSSGKGCHGLREQGLTEQGSHGGIPHGGLPHGGFGPRCARVPSTQQRCALAVLRCLAFLLEWCFHSRRARAARLGTGLRGGVITSGVVQFWFIADQGRGVPRLSPRKNPKASSHKQIFFKDIWAQAAKVLKMSILSSILTISGHRPPKCSKLAF